MRLQCLFAMILALVVLIPVGTVEAYIWENEYNGQANLEISGSPFETRAEYIAGTLRLAANCISYASATARGEMHVCGLATSTGWVTGSISWYQKGNLAGGGIGSIGASIRIKFQAVEVSTGNLVEKVVLDKNGPWPDEGTQYWDSMDIHLQQGHPYKFILSAEVHAHTLGLGAAIADFGGIYTWSDSRIEWSYISVPNILPNHDPVTPSAPSGPTSGTMTAQYTYHTSTTDMDGDNVCYQFDWGDGSTTTTGWYASGATASASHQWPMTYPDAYYRVKVQAQDINGLWSYWSPGLLVHMRRPDSGGGCPYVSTWNGTHYVLDNNLIPSAEVSNGTDVVDHYLLQNPLVKENGKYSLRIWDLDKHSYLDKAQLLAVCHESDVNVALTPEGKILTYKEPLPLVTATSSNGTDVLDLLTSADDQSFEGYAGDYVTLDFGNADVQNGAKLVLRSDECHPNCKTSIHIQIENATGSWNQVASYIPRMYMSTDIIDLSGHLPDANGKLRVRAYFTSQHKLDYVGLDTTKQGEFETRYATMASATHSNTTDVKTTLANSDNIYVELWPSEHVILEFALPETTQETRDYIIILEGHYFTIS